MRFFVLAAVFCVCCATAEARGPRRNYTYTSAPAVNADTSSAQGVAEAQAQCGSCRHFGGNSGYEGVGYSTVSADAAIRSCCFWGQRKPREIGVARGARGWFACVRYH
jgi:hypothetical protein